MVHCLMQTIILTYPPPSCCECFRKSLGHAEKLPIPLDHEDLALSLCSHRLLHQASISKVLSNIGIYANRTNMRRNTCFHHISNHTSHLLTTRLRLVNGRSSTIENSLVLDAYLLARIACMVDVLQFRPLRIATLYDNSILISGSGSGSIKFISE